MDIDNMTDIDLLRKLAKRDRIRCVASYDGEDISFVAGYWYLYSPYYSGGIIVWTNSDIPHYSKHIVLSVHEGIKYFDLRI